MNDYKVDVELLYSDLKLCSNTLYSTPRDIPSIVKVFS